MQKTKVEQLDGIAIEYRLAPKMLVFSHGFGVRRDTDGFFTELAKNLPEGYGYVLFDYYRYDDTSKTIELTDFTQQVAMLTKVTGWVTDQPEVEEISLLAHSMGCIVAAIAKPPAKHSILLAPPTSIGERTRRYFTTRPGARQEGQMWLVPRRSGGISKIPDSMFDEFEEIDAKTLLRDYMRTHDTVLIVAGADEVLTDQEADYKELRLLPDLKSFVVENADHNFQNESRKELIKILKEVL